MSIQIVIWIIVNFINWKTIWVNCIYSLFIEINIILNDFSEKFGQLLLDSNVIRSNSNHFSTLLFLIQKLFTLISEIWIWKWIVIFFTNNKMCFSYVSFWENRWLLYIKFSVVMIRQYKICRTFIYPFEVKGFFLLVKGKD